MTTRLPLTSRADLVRVLAFYEGTDDAARGMLLLSLGFQIGDLGPTSGGDARPIPISARFAEATSSRGGRFLDSRDQVETAGVRDGSGDEPGSVGIFDDAQLTELERTIVDAETAAEGAVVHSSDNPPRRTPLSPWRRLGPLVQSALTRNMIGQALDVPALVRRWARAEFIGRLPRRRRRAWSRVVVVVDGQRRLAPVHDDQAEVVARLRREAGRDSVRVRILIDGPEGPMFDEAGRLCGFTEPTERSIPLLVLGDLGLEGSTRVRAAWRRLGRELRDAGRQIVAVVPASLARWDRRLAILWSAIPWERRRLRDRVADPEGGRRLPEAGISVEERLLALASPAMQIEVGLLRALRLLLPNGEADVGNEIAVWNDPRLATTLSGGRSIRPKYLEVLRRGFLASDELGRRALALLRRWHWNRDRVPEAWHLEVLVLDHLLADAGRSRAEFGLRDAEVGAAKCFLVKLAGQLRRDKASGFSDDSLRGWLGFVRGQAPQSMLIADTPSGRSLQIIDLRTGGGVLPDIDPRLRALIHRRGPSRSHPFIHSRLRHGGPGLVGRKDELAWLDRVWTDRESHVATVVGWGGSGKTALVAEWRNRLLAQGHAPDGLFEWSFYSQGVRDRGAVSADNFLREALRFFGDKEMAESATAGWEKGTRLAELIGERRSLLLLDGLEPLQYAQSSAVNPGGLKETSIEALLKCLAARNRGLCVVTTRVPVSELERFGPTLAPRLDLDTLSEAAGSDLLRSLLEPAGGKPVPSTQEERRAISREARGHPLTLQLLGTYIYHALGDIRRWRELDLERANTEQGGHAFRVMDAYAAWLSAAGPRGQQQLAALRLLGFFDRPADPGCIAALRASPTIPGVTEALDGVDAEEWSALTASLEQLRLMTRSDYVTGSVRGYDEAAAQQAGENGPPAGVPKQHHPQDYGPNALVLDAHPLVREFFARELRRTHEAGWREGHRRLYEHLCRAVPYWPEGPEGLQPLYQAVVHGCAAGQTADACNDVYRARILRGTRFYSRRQLGAVSADLTTIACFFERIWDEPSAALDGAAQAWVLGEAAFCLRATGRLREALEPMRAGLEKVVQQENWKNAAIAAGNLSELRLTLGQTGAAVEDAAKSVQYADRSGDYYQRMVKRTILANARHQAGDLAGARSLFEEAEFMHARLEPTEPRLYSLRGHRYCDLLLRPAEREAWRAATGDPSLVDGPVTHCQEVVDRAIRTLEFARQNSSLLDIALDHLTLGRAALYAAMLLVGSPRRTALPPDLSFSAARTHLDAAVDGFRKAGSLDELPRALIARAQLYYRDAPDLARRDLDEAWTLADPMPLYQADILLTRARLFRNRADLARARELIDRHGYGRRSDELADAEQALVWPVPEPHSPPAPLSPHTPILTPPWDPNLRPDIAILIALPEEFRTLADEYSHAWYARPNPDHSGSDFLFVGPGGYRCTATIMPHMGPTVAGQVSMRLFGLRPATVINIGIAGSFRSDALRIGDVIVPRQVDAYDETGKVDGVQWMRRGSDYRPSVDLVADVLDFEFTARDDFSRWVRDGADQLNALRTGPDNEQIEELLKSNILRTAPVVSTNHLASGSFVVANKAFAEFIREANADIHAVEMEAAGMMAAAEHRPQQPKTLVVRGISDHIDADKRKVDAIGEGALRRLAMANAWRLVCTLMRLGRLPRVDVAADTYPPRQAGPTVSPFAASTPSPTGTKLFVGGLAWATKEDSLRAAFEKAGTVVGAVVIMDRMSGRSKGFGFVEMGTPEEAQAAIAMWHEQELDGRKIMVNEARPKEERNSRGG